MKKSSIMQAATQARLDLTNTADPMKLLQEFSSKFNIDYASAGGFSLVRKKDEGKYLLTFPNRKSPSKFRLLIGEAIAAVYLGIDNLSGRAEAATAKADCHAFAMEFFLPEKEFIHEIVTNGYNEERLISLFKIEKELLYKRASELMDRIEIAKKEKITANNHKKDKKIVSEDPYEASRKQVIKFFEKDDSQALQVFLTKNRKIIPVLFNYKPEKLGDEINLLHTAAICDAKKCFNLLAKVANSYLFTERFPRKTSYSKEDGIIFSKDVKAEGYNPIEMAAALGDIETYTYMRNSINQYLNFNLVPGQDSCAQFFAMQGNIGQLEKLRPEELHHEGENGRTALTIALENPAGLSLKAKNMFVNWLERQGFAIENVCFEATNG